MKSEEAVSESTDTNIFSNLAGVNTRTQIEQGANADVFASANLKQMNSLGGQGFLNNSSVAISLKEQTCHQCPCCTSYKHATLSDLSRPGLKLVIGTKDVPWGNAFH